MNRVFIVLAVLLPFVAAFSRSPLRPTAAVSKQSLNVIEPTTLTDTMNSLVVAEVDGQNIFATLGSAAFIGVLFLSSLFDFLKQFDKPRKDNGF